MVARYIPASLVAMIVLTISQVNANGPDPPPLTGHNFDFSATWPSGVTISTLNAPATVFSAEDVALVEPTLTLLNLASTDEDKDEYERYTSFLEISYISRLEPDAIGGSFTWVKTNLTVLPSGTLNETDESLLFGITGTALTSDVRNATLHVWRQNEELMSALDDLDFTFLFQLARTWGNITDYMPKNFPRSNVDFKVRNETGAARDGVDENGALLPQYYNQSTTTSSATTTPTASPTASVTPTETPNAASSQGVLPLWPMVISGLLLLASAVSAL
ncbi:hypothetical protein M426DRAFT_320472 [Hypoxylon sp. CI-4A]|nr:hypothetical protein M426DRAFT_320472 [Hypoxylon sp. CI-4A]